MKLTPTPDEIRILAAFTNAPEGQALIAVLQRYQASLEAEARDLDAPAVFRNLGGAAALVEVCGAIQNAQGNLVKMRSSQAHAAQRRGVAGVIP
jgi:hypothetical protein